MSFTPTVVGAPVGAPLSFPATFGPELASMDVAFHDVEITGEDGAPVFVQKAVEAPAGWSPRAVKVAASKYLYGDAARGHDPRTGGREHSVIDLHLRVANFIAEHGFIQGLYAADQVKPFRDELVALTLGQYGAFNSPVWFNVGLDSYGIKGDDRTYVWDPDQEHGAGAVRQTRDTVAHPQGSACFIQSVEDNMESLMELARSEAMLFKRGSGTGTDFSTIRSEREKLSNGGKPSGPLSFMGVYDTIAGVIKSGGKTRRAAKMQTMHVQHPDVLKFIRAKGLEERKAHALIAMGYESNFNGEAYSSVKFQNANFTVRVPRAFMCALQSGRDQRWRLKAVTTGATIDTVDPHEIWDAIAEETWRCGDPGVQFCDTINEWHTCPNRIGGGYQPINSSNPCSEYLFIDDSACNLASLNLMRFTEGDGSIDVDRLRAAVRVFITAQEILVDACSYPTRKIAQNSHDFRTLGLGFANLGGLLQSNGIPYDSDEGRWVAGALAGIIGGEAYRWSAVLAAKVGPFAGYAVNRKAMTNVLSKHAWAAAGLYDAINEGLHLTEVVGLVAQLPELAFEAQTCWDEAVLIGEDFGYRNAQVTNVAPTGTIAFTMDCDTTGIEPNLALNAQKTLAGGGSMSVVNRLVPMALAALGFDEPHARFIADYVAFNGTAEGCALLDDDQVAVFDTSFAPPGFSRTLRWQAHLLMVAAVQPFISGAISKTVNMPADATVHDISECYEEAERLGVKCVAIYRDGSKMSQPLTAKGAETVVIVVDEAAGQIEPDAYVVKVECVQCGSLNIVQSGTCGICHECGTTTGCS